MARKKATGYNAFRVSHPYSTIYIFFFIFFLCIYILYIFFVLTCSEGRQQWPLGVTYSLPTESSGSERLSPVGQRWLSSCSHRWSSTSFSRSSPLRSLRHCQVLQQIQRHRIQWNHWQTLHLYFLNDLYRDHFHPVLWRITNAILKFLNPQYFPIAILHL